MTINVDPRQGDHAYLYRAGCAEELKHRGIEPEVRGLSRSKTAVVLEPPAKPISLTDVDAIAEVEPINPARVRYHRESQPADSSRSAPTLRHANSTTTRIREASHFGGQQDFPPRGDRGLPEHGSPALGRVELRVEDTRA